MIIDEQWECWMDPMRDKYDENVLKKLKAGTYRGEKGRHLLWTRLSPPLRVKNKSWAGGNRRDDKYIYICGCDNAWSSLAWKQHTKKSRFILHSVGSVRTKHATHERLAAVVVTVASAIPCLSSRNPTYCCNVAFRTPCSTLALRVNTRIVRRRACAPISICWDADLQSTPGCNTSPGIIWYLKWGNNFGSEKGGVLIQRKL